MQFSLQRLEVGKIAWYTYDFFNSMLLEMYHFIIGIAFNRNNAMQVSRLSKSWQVSK